MELYITELPSPEIATTTHVEEYDVHGEDKATGFCEICFGQDELVYLTVWHPTRGEHAVAHIGCLERSGGSFDDWVYCTCQ
jgi:hypothetical protein